MPVEAATVYSLEMICADFLAGAALERGDPNKILDAQHPAATHS